MVVRYVVRGETFQAKKAQLWIKKPDISLYDLAPNDQRFAVAQETVSEPKSLPHVTLLLNFFSELHLRAAAGGK